MQLLSTGYAHRLWSTTNAWVDHRQCHESLKSDRKPTRAIMSRPKLILRRSAIWIIQHTEYPENLPGPANLASLPAKLDRKPTEAPVKRTEVDRQSTRVLRSPQFMHTVSAETRDALLQEFRRLH